ncbi:putative kinesin-related protein bimC [Podospora appendiculata]|uniref:Kinesin-related protein bimC n=1 Tax=Podospora appendiculata TaxID=314037 RepID=A0AAE0XHE0_9PEZI|nr:putative kinesin-related protein bimC [Podospora appendiculata]
MERRTTSTMASRATAAAAATATTTSTATRASSIRPGVRNTALPPRRVYGRSASVAPRIDRAGAASPVESLMSVATSATAGAKRKEREFDPADDGEATNINVVVRCRGRNEREVRENSAVVVSTEGVKAQLVNLSMGPNALSNKTYNFDRVFSQAADQSMIFEDTVKPMMDEMLAGYNCTIFAYGQTGTGKTYTMSGDMSSTLGLLPDTAGIIPRVLHSLFARLEADESENCVRCSFIELYNEELRDLLSADENAKLKIYDDNSRKGHATTVVQGMEERHISSATEGLRWLQEGSIRRQVAATKCNDLSSRSHTVFTITLYVKRQTENGEDFLAAGKLNLVDLAGSENIQRSGAENKRAAEAGLINKSLLTLGRVINALVDRGSHIPYRESKLTRLLQDSLGGRTKTCIIATISPAKVNLEETISTLDYAFRAKNIRNKPQMNALINKKTLLREFTAEIEKLKSELIATRQRNGVHLSNEAYEEITVQNESRRILTEEQAAKIGALENNLRNKGQELFTLTSSFMGLKKEHEGTRLQLDETVEVLDQTELILAATRRALTEETLIRKAHQATEEQLAAIGGELITTIEKTVNDVDGLRAKNKRKSELHNINRSTWSMSQAQVSGITELVEGRIEKFRQGQEEHISSISERMQSFVQEELEKLASTQTFLDENLERFADSKTELLEQKEKSKEEMDDVLEEIKTVRDSVKLRVGESLQAIAAVAERIAGDVLSELGTFHNQLHASYSSLGKDFKAIFEELVRHISAQKDESDELRQQLEDASRTIFQTNVSVSARIQAVLDEERRQAAAERRNLLAQISTLITSQAEAQETRLAGKAALIQQTVKDANETFGGSLAQYSEGMDIWSDKDDQLLENVGKFRDTMKTKFKDDWATANDHSQSIQTTTQSVHAETMRVVDEQMKDLDTQMKDLDDFVTRARSQNADHHAQHADAMQSLSATVEDSYASISTRFQSTFDRVKTLNSEVETAAQNLQHTLDPMDEDVCQPLARLRDDIQNTVLREYEPTGDTPQKMEYQFPTSLPRTRAHEALLADVRDRDRDSDDESCTPTKPSSSSSPSIPVHFGEAETSTPQLPTIIACPPTSSSSASHERPPLGISLREVNPNVSMLEASDVVMGLPGVGGLGENAAPPQLAKRGTRHSTRFVKKKTSAVGEGLENVPPGSFGQSVGSRRKSPRLH